MPERVSPASIPPAGPPATDPEATRTYSGAFAATPALVPELPRAAADTGLPAVEGYTVLRVLGRGGMGIVYLARQEGLNRLVALKMILAGEHAAPEYRARFRAEAEAVARLHHPYIVQIHDVGETAGHPFFCLEYLEGGSLARRLGGSPQPPRAAAELVRTLVWAVHHAHQAGIIHRDLKPANVLLTEAGAPKITDFGLAKQTDDPSSRGAGPASPTGYPPDAGPSSRGAGPVSPTGYPPDAGPSSRGAGPVSPTGYPPDAGPAGQTQSGQVMGTPSYMAPEQAAGKKDVGPAADVYALGAILYETLTGRPPFRGESVLDTLEQVRTQEPVPPVRLQLRCPRDLETICLECLRKEPARRYASARELAGDLQRFLDGEPIRARPVGMLERLVKWARRRPAVAALSALSVVLAVTGFALVNWKWLEADDQRAAAEQQRGRAEDVAREEKKARDDADRERAAADTQRDRAEKAEKKEKARADAESQARADETRARADEARAREQAESSLYLTRVALADSEVRAGNVASARRLLDACPVERRHWEWHYLEQLCRTEQFTVRGHKRTVTSAHFSPDGRRLLTVGVDQVVKEWDAATGQELAVQSVPPAAAAGRLGQVDYHVAGRRLAVLAGTSLAVWDLGAGKPLLQTTLPEGNTAAVALSHDGTLVAASSYDLGTKGIVRTWDVATGKEVRTIRLDTGDHSLLPALAFSPDGKRLAAASPAPGKHGEIKLWDVEGRQALRIFRCDHFVSSVAFSPDGRWLAAAESARNDTEGVLRVWYTTSGAERLAIRGYGLPLHQVAFSPDGARLAAAAGKERGPGQVYVWDATFGTRLLALHGHASTALAVAFSADGRRLASGGKDATVKVWDADGQPVLTFPGQAGWVRSVAFHPHGRHLAAASNEVRVWGPTDPHNLFTFQGWPDLGCSVAFSPDSRTLAAASARPGRQGATVLWDVAGRRRLRTLLKPGGPVHNVAFSPDGKLVATASGGIEGTDVKLLQSGVVRLWHADGKGEARSLRGHDGPAFRVAFRPDGKQLAAAGFDRTVRLWDVDTGREGPILRGHGHVVTGVAYSPDGKRLASCSIDGTVRLWGADGKPESTFGVGGGPVLSVAFHPDGKRLAAGGLGAIHVWDLQAAKVVLILRAHTAQVNAVAFSPDGKRLASAGGQTGERDGEPFRRGEVRVWDIDSGRMLFNPEAHSGPVLGVAWAADGRTLATASQDETVRLWDVGEAVKVP